MGGAIADKTPIAPAKIDHRTHRIATGGGFRPQPAVRTDLASAFDPGQPTEVARVYLGVGANLGNPNQTFDSALTQLEQANIRVCRESRRITTPPMGPPGQPPYLNSVIEAETELGPLALLTAVKGIEKGLGRVPTVRWGPRALDLDILLYDLERVDLPELTIPHRGLSFRAFVLEPLAELAPDLLVPGLDCSVQILAERLNGR